MLGEGEAFASVAQARRALDLAMALHNRINFEVMERKPALPAGIEVHANPMENLGPKAPLGQWAAGFGAGQLRAEEAWERCLREEGSDKTFDAALGSLNAALGFFMHRELAEKWRLRMPGEPPLEEAARHAQRKGRPQRAVPLWQRAQVQALLRRGCRRVIAASRSRDRLRLNYRKSAIRVECSP